MILSQKIYKFIFAVLVFIICSDINNMLSKYYGTDSLLSFLILFIVFFLMVVTSSRKMFYRSKAITIFYVLFAWFLIYGSLVTLFIKFPGQEIGYRWRYYLPAIFLLVVTVKLCEILIRTGQIDWLINIYTFSLLFNCVVILWNGFFGLRFLNVDDLDSGDRVGGLFDSVNQAGMIASLGQIFVLSFLFNNKQKFSSFTIFVAYGICVLAGFLTFSKAAFVNMGLIFFSFIIMSTLIKRNFHYVYSTRRFRFFIFFLFLTLIVFYLNFVHINSQLTQEQISRLEQFFSLLNGNIDSETTTKRSDIGGIALDYIIKNPLLGYGLGTFHALPNIRLGTHNEYLLIWGESGLIGLILYLFFLFYLFRKMFQIKNFRIKFLVLLFALFLIVSSMVSHNILNAKFLIVIIGFILSLLNNIVLINKNS